MTIKEYTEQIAKEFSKRIDKPVVAMEKVKNNGILFNGLEITETNTIDSIFYVNNLYKDNVCVADAVDKLCMWFEELKEERLRSYKWLCDFSLVKDKLCYKLVNKEENEFMMKDYVCEEFLDLLKIYTININDLSGNIQLGSIMIEKRLLELWNVTEKEIKELAEENIELILPCIIAKMSDVMKRIIESKGGMLSEEFKNRVDDSKLWVMTNEYRYDGAATICYKNDLKQFACAMGCDIYILPSSVHEIFLLPAGETTTEYLKQLVAETNDIYVADEEFLSDNVYIYKRESELIEILE